MSLTCRDRSCAPDTAHTIIILLAISSTNDILGIIAEIKNIFKVFQTVSLCSSGCLGTQEIHLLVPTS